VVDLTRYLPGAFASSELLRLGARGGEGRTAGWRSMRHTSTEWHELLNAGKESVVCELPRERAFARSLLERADVVLESFRPASPRSSASARTTRPRMPCTADHGLRGRRRHEQRAGHDVNYLGWAGLLADTAPSLPPCRLPIFAAGALGAVTRCSRPSVARGRTGEGARIVISMTHGSHKLLPRAPVRTDGFACYAMYACADDRWLTVGSARAEVLHAHLRARRPAGARRTANDADQVAGQSRARRSFLRAALEHWLALFDGETSAWARWRLRPRPRVSSRHPRWAPPRAGEHTAPGAASSRLARLLVVLRADAPQGALELRRNDPDFVRLALCDQRERLDVLVRKQLRIRIPFVDRAEDRVDRLRLTFRLEDRRSRWPWARSTAACFSPSAVRIAAAFWPSASRIAARFSRSARICFSIVSLIDAVGRSPQLDAVDADAPLAGCLVEHAA